MNLPAVKAESRMPEPDGDVLSEKATLQRQQRLRKNSQIRTAYAQGNRYVGRYMVLWTCKLDDSSLRLGVVASKKVGNAVQRARAKRRLRAAYRLHRHQLTGGCDVVLVARRSILRAEWRAVESELLWLAKKIGLLITAQKGDPD